MINNRQNGRRRGRGGQQPRGMSGNSGGNARDNRQRGNAAQLHEKYKSMARDAQLSGDRVQTEYYLQFADHYFRLLGDARPRFDEQKRGRDDDMDDDGDDRDSDMDNDNDGDDGDQDDQPQPQRQQPRARNDRELRGDREPRGDREQPQQREPRADREPRRERVTSDRGPAERAEPRRDRPNGRVRDDERPRGRPAPEAEDERIDFAILPPAIVTASDDLDEPLTSAPEADQAEEAPRPRRRVRRPREDSDTATS